MSIRRLFRAFGPLRIYMPDSASDHDWDGGETIRGNLLEICYATSDGKSHLAFARLTRWENGELPAPPVQVPPENWTVFTDAGRDQVTAALRAQDEVSFWITRQAGKQKLGHRLRILGLVALDEFQSENNEHFVRLPLRPRFEWMGRPSGSVVTFGSSGGNTATDELRIEPGLPLPEGSGLRSATLAFGGLFDTSHRTKEGEDPFKELASPRTMVHAAAGHGEPNDVKGWRRRFTAFGSYSKAHCRALSDIAARSGERPDNAAILAALHLKPSKTESGHQIEFLAGRSKGEPTFAIAIRSRIGFRDGLPLLGATAPRIAAGSAEAETVAICRLTDTDLLAALTGPGTGGPSWTLQTALHIEAPLALEDNALQPAEPDGKPLPGGGLGEAARIARIARAGLAATRRQPQSALPDLRFPGKTSSVKIPLAAFPSGLGLGISAGANGAAVAEIKPSSEIGWRTTADTDFERAAPKDQLWIGRLNPSSQVEAELLLPGFDDAGTTAFPVSLTHAASDAGEPGDVRLRFVHRKGASAPLQSRLGALVLKGQRDQLLAGSGAELVLRSADRAPPDPRPQARTVPRLDVEWSFDFALSHAQPVTTDIPHGVREERPLDLLIRETRDLPETPDRSKEEASHATISGRDTMQPTTSPLRLGVVERVRDDQDHRLTAALYDTDSAETGQRGTTVIGDRPFSVYRYRRQSIAESGRDDGGPVAEYDSDGRQWLLRKASQTYLLAMQAGAVGEDAHKPGRLVLRDPDSRDAPAPVASPEGSVLVRHALDMRLSPPTHLWIRPSDLERSFLLPEYAGRELFRQRGDFGLGVSLAALRSEALYGLALGLLVPPPEPGASLPRVAEIEALTGRLPLPDYNSRGMQEKRWGKLYDALAKRPERLEIWQLDPSARDPFQPARFITGTRYALRRTALLARPVNDGWSDPAQDPEASIQPPRFAAHGLSGGALWPVESANLARVVAEISLADDGGTLEGLAISPMGMDANQNLTFGNGAVRVISETREGRLLKQRVEVVGRIGVLWHRAKHVIVYERTTADSPQFAPDDPKQSTGRAALRKVSEFVEILEPVRRYPDTPGADKANRGFLTEVRFNARVIHVDSAWGGDVGTIGWEVPLWNRGAAERRPQIYPFPDIAFVTEAEGRAERPEAAQDCRDPQLLYFYTDAEEIKARRSETDLWPVRDGVDCSVLALPKIQFEEGAGSILDQTEAPPAKGARRPAPSRLLPGLRRFTWRLAPAQSRTRINAGQGQKPVYAGLESVSFSRSMTLSEALKEEIATLAPGVGAAAKVADTPLAAAVHALPFAVTKATGPDAPTPRKLANTVEGLAAALQVAADKTEREKLIEAVELALADLDPVNQAAEIAKYVLGRDAAEALSEASQKISGNDLAKRLYELDTEDCNKLEERASAALGRRRLVVLQAVEGAETQLLSRLDTVGYNKDDLQDALTNALKDETARLTAGMGEAIGGLADGIATARATLADWRADALAALSRAQGRLHEADAALDRAKPWSRDRLDRALAQLDTAFDSAEEEAFAALGEARQRLATELGTNARDLAAPVAASVQSVLRVRLAAQTRIASVSTLLQSQSARIVATIGKLPDLDESRLETLGKKAVEAGGAVEAAWNAVKPELEKLPDRKTDVQNAVKDLEAGTTETLRAIEAKAVEAANAMTAELVGVTTTIDKLEYVAQAALDAGADELAAETSALKTAIKSEIETAGAYARNLLESWLDAGKVIEDALRLYTARARATVAAIEAAAMAGGMAADQWLARFEKTIAKAQTQFPAALKTALDAALERAVTKAFDAVLWPDPTDTAAAKAAATAAIRGLSDRTKEELDALAEGTLSGLEEVKAACTALQGAKAKLIEGGADLVEKYLGGFEQEIKSLKDGFVVLVGNAKNQLDDLDELLDTARALEKQGTTLLNAADGIATEAAAAGEHARAYLLGGIERAGDLLKAKPAALPGKALELVSFLSHSPEIAALRTNADRTRMYLDRARGVLKTPEVQAGLDQLGDALRALGLDFKFDSIADELDILPDGKALKDLIPQFGGIDLRSLLPDTEMPEDIARLVRITHDLDTKAGRAWVQVDLDVPLNGRERLFSLGPFTLFITRSRLTSTLRAEASKDSPEVTVTDKAVLLTDLEAVVSGMGLLTLTEVRITYSRARELEFEIDPRKIRIPQAMQFVQDTFGSIFGDDVGGLGFLRSDEGLVVGVEHRFGLPPISLNFGTSGVSNIQIANRLALQAYPDFAISNRFNLSRRELPFIFSIFIIGGTGYLQLDTEYRPTGDNPGLSVALEAGVGGSAALAFAFGPVAGGVYITLSVVLRYVKRIGGPARPEDGLNVSVVLVIAGNVSLWGMVTIYLGLMLSMSYHETGRIDAAGSLSVEVRISRWFKLKFSTSVTYKLRDGRATTTRTESLQTSGKAVDALEKARALNAARKAL